MKKIISTILTIAMCVSVLSVSVSARPGRPEPPEKPTGTGQAPVCFYVSRWGIQLDTTGNVETRDTTYFSNIVGRTNLNKKMGLNDNVVIGEGVTEEDILENLNNFPADKIVFNELSKEYKKEGAVLYTNSGKEVNWDEFNEENYGIMWYVLKIENDGWHVDGYVYEIETNDNVNIVLPDEKEDFEAQQKENEEAQDEAADDEIIDEDVADDEAIEEPEEDVADDEVIEEDPADEEESEDVADVETEDTSIHLSRAKYAYVFGYEPIITVVTDEETGETYTTAQIEMGMDNEVLVEEVCAMLVRMLDQAGYTDGQDFPIVDAVAPHAGQWYERGLSYLCSVGGFDPETPIEVAPVTRAEVAKLVSCALNLNLSSETPFVDIEGNPYKAYIEKVYNYGYMQGVSDNEFNPDANMTRAEFCALFNNILLRNDYGLTALDENGEEFEITAEDYYIIDMDPGHWAYEICLKASSAYDDDGYVDLQTRTANIRNIIDRHEAQREF